MEITLWIREGQADIIQFLIEHGADVTKKDYKDRNPLEVAIEKGNQKAIKTIITSSQWKEAMRSCHAVNGRYGQVGQTYRRFSKILRNWTLP